MTTSLDYDPIHALESCGYTEREAAFLYIVAIHSGYFLRRQFLGFLKREDGAIVQRFLQKAVRFGHVRAIAYQHGRHIYHLKARPVYELLDQTDSQNRREKGDRQIKMRLMQLDLVIEHFGQKFLETEQQKVEFFHGKLGVPLTVLPRFLNTGTGNESDSQQNQTTAPQYFPDRFPIAVEETPKEPPLVRFVYIDEGMRTISAFTRWLRARVDLIRKLFHAEVIYVSDTKMNHDAAEHEYLRYFPKPSPQTPKTGDLRLGVDHLIQYLKARRKAEDNSPLFCDERQALAEGGQIYIGPEFEELVCKWKQGRLGEGAVRFHYAPKSKPPVIRAYLLTHDYPVWSVKYRRAIV